MPRQRIQISRDWSIDAFAVRVAEENHDGKWWEHLRALEDAIWPFAIVVCRMKPAPTTPLIDRDQFGPLGRQHLDRMKVPTTRSGIEELEAIVVDTKTFHCTLGYVWEMDKGMPPKQWADEAALGLKVAYMRGYNL